MIQTEKNALSPQETLFTALGEIDPAQVEDAMLVKVKKIPLWAKYSSAAACLLVLVVAVVFISGLLGGTKVYADTAQLNPPILGLHWGMTMDEVEAIIGKEKGFFHAMDYQFTLFNWKGTVFGVPIYTPADENMYFGNVGLNFSIPQSFEGEDFPSMLKMVSFIVRTDNLQETADLLSKNLGIPYEKVADDKYEFYSTGSIKSVTKEDFYFLYNLYILDSNYMQERAPKETTDALWERLVQDTDDALKERDFFPLMTLEQWGSLDPADSAYIFFYGGMDVFRPNVK